MQYVVLGGISVYGPFDSKDDAFDWAAKNYDKSYEVKLLEQDKSVDFTYVKTRPGFYKPVNSDFYFVVSDGYEVLHANKDGDLSDVTECAHYDKIPFIEVDAEYVSKMFKK